MTSTIRRGLSSLRFLLLWPVFTAYRRRARRSLRWRLAGYNLLTLMAGLATAFILVGLLAAAGAGARNYAEEEPADDARAVARFLNDGGFVRPGEPITEDSLRPIGTLANGSLPLYREPRPDQFDVRPDRHLLGLKSVTVLAPELPLDGYVRDEAAMRAIASAASGGSDLRANSALRDFQDSAGVGAYPLIDASRQQRGVVVVEKFDIQAPKGWAILRAQIRPVVTTVWIGSVIAAVPGLAVAVLLAVAAARSVGGRIRNVAHAAEALASGDLSSRAPESGEDEVASLSRSFNGMAAQLQSAMGLIDAERGRAVALLEANRQLVANVSHELRTPVSLVRGQVEALGEDTPGNARVEMALREIERLERLVTDLFVLASAEARPIAPVVEPVVLGTLVATVTSPIAESALREARVTVVSEHGGADSVTVATDPARLASAIQNVLRNAVRHTPEGGLVRVFVGSEGAFGLVQVSDTGSGIAPEDLPRVFERFYRGDASRSRDSGGAGLGLAIAREFIEATGGSISVESPPGEGATFTICLPLVP